MKKAIVIAITMILGLGLTAFAGPLSGSWASSLVIDPAASSFDSLTSTLAVDYTVSGWTFGSSSGFALIGWTSQSFTTGGSFGAFTLSSTMTFNPMFVSIKTYDTVVGDLPTSVPTTPAATQTASVVLAALCDRTYTSTTAPLFETWETEGSISIGGVELGALFLIDNSNANIKLENYVFDYTIDGAPTLANSTSVVSGKNGSGARLKVAGSIGDITATSYTYLNLTETLASTATCPTVGKSGTISIAVAGCDIGLFTEQYITLEGFVMDCVTIDVGLSIDCDLNMSAVFVAKDIAIGEWLELDFGLTFTTTSKTPAFCFTAVLPESDCLTIEFGPEVSTTGSFSGLDFYGIGFSYTWDAVTFTSDTELNIKSALISTATAWSYVNGSVEQGFLVPYVGYNAPAVTVPVTAPTKYLLSAEIYELKCLPTYRFKLWERFVIDIDGDACCGGALDLTISTWFGDKEVLSYVGYGTYTEKEESATPYTLLGTVQTFADRTAPTVDTDVVSFVSGYAADAATTLFNWAKTEVDVSVGVASNITLDLGFNVSAFGWESLEVGFTFDF